MNLITITIDADTQVVVPIEPTPDMIAAGYDASWIGEVDDDQMTKLIYAAMLTAAPSNTATVQSDERKP